MSVENLNGEIWKVIDHPSIGSFPNYMVSNMGRVKSLNYNKTDREWIMKATKSKLGYLQVGFRIKGKQKRFYVHRLVALMFIPNTENLLCINHKDEDKTNNTIENLEWCTHHYNNTYGTRVERVVKKYETSIAFKEAIARQYKTVYQYTTDGVLVNIFPSVAEMEKQTEYYGYNVSKCANKKQKTAYGFIWSYEPIETSSNQLTLFPLTTKKIS